MTQTKFAKEMNELETKLNKVCKNYETLKNIIAIDPFVKMDFNMAVCTINDKIDELQRKYIYRV